MPNHVANYSSSLPRRALQGDSRLIEEFRRYRPYEVPAPAPAPTPEVEAPRALAVPSVPAAGIVPGVEVAAPVLVPPAGYNALVPITATTAPPIRATW